MRGVTKMYQRACFDVIGGAAIVWAYFRSWLRREEMLSDPKVVRYVRRTQLRKLAGVLVREPVHETRKSVLESTFWLLTVPVTDIKFPVKGNGT